jgi:hypothetical protein
MPEHTNLWYRDLLDLDFEIWNCLSVLARETLSSKPLHVSVIDRTKDSPTWSLILHHSSPALFWYVEGLLCCCHLKVFFGEY